jgi:hypothetical protein
VKESTADDLIAAARRGATKAITLLETDEADLLRKAPDSEGLAKLRSALLAARAVRAALFSNPETTNRP